MANSRTRIREETVQGIIIFRIKFEGMENNTGNYNYQQIPNSENVSQAPQAFTP